MALPLFYTKPVPLDKQKHVKFKLKRQDNFGFAAGANSIPLAGFEFFEASRQFPIFFVKTHEEKFLPIAILSLRKDGHDLGDNWEDSYIPAYLRRYPFILSHDGVVMFDEEAPHLQEGEGEALFGEDGETSKITNDIINFLQNVDKGYRLTEGFSKALADKELLEPFKGKVNFPNGSVDLGKLYTINEKKMHETLSEPEVNEWFKKGWLGWSHAQLHSVGAVNQILRRARAAAPKAETADA